MFSKDNFMKSHYLILIILFYSCSNKTTTHCYNAATNNIIYKGVMNPLIISSNKKIIKVESYNAKIEKGNNKNKYSIITKQSDSIIIVIKTKNKTEKFYFRIKEIPEPTLSFNRPIQNNEIKVDDFKTLKHIACFIPEIEIDVSFRIKNIEIIRISKNNEVYREICNVKDSKLISLAEVGDIYIFDNIVIEYGESEKIDKKSEILKIIE